MTEHLPAEDLVDLADDALAADRRSHAEAHLAECASCRGELDLLRAEPATDLERARVARSAIALVRASSQDLRLAASAASADTLPDPVQGTFLCRFEEADLEVYGFDAVDGYRLVLYYADRAAFNAVQVDGLAEQRAFPTGWVGRIVGATETGRDVKIDYSGVTYSLRLLARSP